MSANIKVVVRVRPLNKREMKIKDRIVVDVVDDRMLVFDPKEEIRPFPCQRLNRNYLKRENKELKFVFDNVCGSNATNQDVFEITTKDILSSLMEGYNCSVFVYGGTGAGKTFTMIGNQEHPGIIYLTMEHLFHTINSFGTEREFDIGVSYIEVYNEHVYDILNPSSTPLRLRVDSKGGVVVVGMTLKNINTVRELLNVLEDRNKHRTQHPTNANAIRSRSHAVFQVYVKMSYETSSQLRTVKLSMIDLAGWEKATATGGSCSKEGANVNKSLLSLGNCINKLADGSSYIPYRDSKLTYLMKDSLSGNCKTVMIANVSPLSLSYDDTYNTLKYAARANKIQLSIKKNIVDGDKRLSQYVEINKELNKKVTEFKTKLSLSSVKVVSREVETSPEKAQQEWRQRITDLEKNHSVLHTELLEMMTQQRVLALQQRFHMLSYSYVVDLAHRSSTEGIEEICTEDIPRQQREAESYIKTSADFDSKVLIAGKKWEESKKHLQDTCNQAIVECPQLSDFIDKIKLQSDMRHLTASNDLRYKLLVMEDAQIDAMIEYTNEISNIINKLYYTLKGYDLAPPAFVDEYLELMRKVNLSKSIDCSDKLDPHLDLMLNLDLEKLCSSVDYSKDVATTIDILTNSDDLTDAENREPVKRLPLKRKGTLINKETILFDDSFKSLDESRNLNSAKKLKREPNAASVIENFAVIDLKNLNFNFDLGVKMDTWKKPVMTKTNIEQPMKKKALVDRTNIKPNNITFINWAQVMKPMMDRTLQLGRIPMGTAPQPRRFAFGSSLSRDGTPWNTNLNDMGRNKWNYNQKPVRYKSVRARGREQWHPYSRPSPGYERN